MDFVSQADTNGLASFMHKCLECCAYSSEHHLACPYDFSCWPGFRSQTAVSVKLPLFCRYSFVSYYL